MKKEGNTYKGNLTTSNEEGDQLISYGEYDQNDNLEKGVERVDTHPISRAAGFEKYHLKYKDKHEQLFLLLFFRV